MRFYHRFPCRSKFVHILELWGPFGCSENLKLFYLQVMNLCELMFFFSVFEGFQSLQNFFSLVWTTVICGTCGSKGHLLLIFPGVCDSWKMLASVASFKSLKVSNCLFCSSVLICLIPDCFRNWDFITYLLQGPGLFDF